MSLIIAYDEMSKQALYLFLVITFKGVPSLQSPTQRNAEVLLLGAGVAGVTAARILHNNDMLCNVFFRVVDDLMDCIAIACLLVAYIPSLVRHTHAHAHTHTHTCTYAHLLPLLLSPFHPSLYHSIPSITIMQTSTRLYNCSINYTVYVLYCIYSVHAYNYTVYKCTCIF